MSVAAAIRQMLAAGLTLEHALLAAEAMEQNTLPTRTKRQERNHRYYEKRKVEASEKRLKASETSEQDPALNDPLPSSLPSENNLNPPPYSPPTTSLRSVVATPKTKPEVRGSRLPSDWVLPDDWRQWAVDNGLRADAVDGVALRFANYWQAKAGRDACKVDWKRTWQNWVVETLDRKPGLRGPPSPSASSPGPLIAVDRESEEELCRILGSRWRYEHEGAAPRTDGTKVWLPTNWVAHTRSQQAKQRAQA